MENELYFDYYDSRKIYYRMEQFSTEEERESFAYVSSTVQETLREPDEVWNNRTSELPDAIYYFLCIKMFANATIGVYVEIKDDLTLYLYKIEVFTAADVIVQNGVERSAVDGIRKGLLIKSKFR